MTREEARKTLEFIKDRDNMVRKSRRWKEVITMAIEELDSGQHKIKEDETEDGNTMSVAHEISALALINVKDIFSYMITAKDAEICERYVTEERAVDVAEKYMEIAMKASALETFIKGWSMTYTQPIKDSDERREYTAMFYDRGQTHDKEKSNQTIDHACVQKAHIRNHSR